MLAKTIRIAINRIKDTPSPVMNPSIGDGYPLVQRV